MRLDEGSGAQLEALVRAEGDEQQPNAFDAAIAKEMQQGSSMTWQTRFSAHVRSEAIPVPYTCSRSRSNPSSRAASRYFQTTQSSSSLL